jgi:hypothetical protein
MQTFLAAVARRAADAQPGAPTLGALLGYDELVLIATSASPTAAACMGCVSRLWARVCSASPVWRALAATHWLGPIDCVGAASARRAVLDVERALRLVATGRRPFCLLTMQDGRLRAPAAGGARGPTVGLRCAPFRLLAAFGGARPLCCISLCSSEASSVYDAARAAPAVRLPPFAVSCMHSEPLDEADAYATWAAAEDPGPGLLLDDAVHQCFMWDVEPAPPGASCPALIGGSDEGAEPPVWATPPPLGDGAPPLVLCGLAVARVKRRDVAAWVPLDQAAPAPLHVVAVQQEVAVNSGQYALSQTRERGREVLRIEWECDSERTLADAPSHNLSPSPA